MANIISDLAATEYLDAIASIYLKIRGSDPVSPGSPSNPNGFGLGLEGGDWGAASLVGDAVQAVVDAALVGVDGIDPIVALGTSAQGLKSRINTRVVAASLLTEPVSSLSSHIASAQIAGVSNLEAFLTYRNTGEASKWKIMVPPAFALLWKDLYNTELSKENVWFEVLQGATYANALAGFNAASSAFLDGFAIDEDKYAGGFPYIKVSGLTGTGQVTVTGTAFNPATKETSENRTWIYNLTGDGTFALVPGGTNAAPTDSLILGVDALGVAVAAGITAGTIYVEAHRPAGRAAFSY